MTAPLSANPVALGLDVNVDVNGRRAQPLVFNRPPEVEGASAGVKPAADVEAADTQGPFGTLAAQNADNINVGGGTLSNVNLINVTVDGGEF